MIDATDAEKTVSVADEDELYDPVEFDPESTFLDEELDGETLAFRDAMHDIWAAEGPFEMLLP